MQSSGVRSRSSSTAQNRIQDVIQTSADRGMFSLDSHLQSLVNGGRIDTDVALAYSQDPPTLRRLLGIGG